MLKSFAVLLIRWMATSQAVGVVIVHGAWLFLAMGIWGTTYKEHAGIGSVIDGLMQALVWLGGMGADGRSGDESTLMVAWLKLSIPLYLLEELRRWRWGERPPMRWWIPVLASAAIAVAGFALALTPGYTTAADARKWAEMVAMVSVGAGCIAALVTAWAVLAHRIADRLITLTEQLATAPVASRSRRSPAVAMASAAHNAPTSNAVEVGKPEAAHSALLDLVTSVTAAEPKPTYRFSKSTLLVGKGAMVLALRARGTPRSEAVEQVERFFEFYGQLSAQADAQPGAAGHDITFVEAPPIIEQLSPAVLEAWSSGHLGDTLESYRKQRERQPSAGAGSGSGVDGQVRIHGTAHSAETPSPGSSRPPWMKKAIIVLGLLVGVAVLYLTFIVAFIVIALSNQS